MKVLETGGIDEYELGLRIRDKAMDTVARRLGFARGDADLLPHQMVEQGGFAHVGATHDRHVTGTIAGIFSRMIRTVVHLVYESGKEMEKAPASSPGSGKSQTGIANIRDMSISTGRAKLFIGLPCRFLLRRAAGRP